MLGAGHAAYTALAGACPMDAHQIMWIAIDAKKLRSFAPRGAILALITCDQVCTRQGRDAQQLGNVEHATGGRVFQNRGQTLSHTHSENVEGSSQASVALFNSCDILSLEAS